MKLILFALALVAIALALVGASGSTIIAGHGDRAAASWNCSPCPRF